MGQCDVFWNGKPVGKATWSSSGRENRAEVRCWQSSGWIYRASLFDGEAEVLRFGVLLPREDCFCAALHLTAGQVAALERAELLRGEVVRSRPEEPLICGLGLPFSQLLPGLPETIQLDPWIQSHLEGKAKLLYSTHCQRNYLLVPMEENGPDPMLSLYCTCRPVQVENAAYLCLLLDENGRVKPWKPDEK